MAPHPDPRHWPLYRRQDRAAFQMLSPVDLPAGPWTVDEEGFRLSGHHRNTKRPWGTWLVMTDDNLLTPVSDEDFQARYRPVLESDGSAEEAYQDRNMLVVAFAHLGLEAGLSVGVKGRDTDWPIVYIDLPTGQISYHIPNGTGEQTLPDYTKRWDEHDLAEKRKRIMRYASRIRNSWEALQ